MKILILEDDLVRQKEFKNNLSKHDITIVDSSKEAIKELKSNKWWILFLDHDLGGQVSVPSGENTGYEVAKFLEENKEYIPTYVIVHSLNPAGAKNILAALPKAIQIPFAWTKKELMKIGLI